MTVIDLTASAAPAVPAECWTCGVGARPPAGTNKFDALREFRRHHPLTAEVPHTPLPRGWQVLLSGPGALSQ